MNYNQLIEQYQYQTEQMFNGQNPNYSKISPNQFAQFANSPMALKHAGIADANEQQQFYTEGGLFTDCALDTSIINTVLHPIHSMANLIPVRSTSDQLVKVGYITGQGAITGAYPDAPCDPSPTAGDVTACLAEYRLGRISYQTKTIELDVLFQKANRGVHEDLFLLGRQRGVSAFATREQMSDRNFVQRGAVRRAMAQAGRLLQNDMITQFWGGDPTNGSQNTANGGRVEYYGLLDMIADDYGAKPYATGTNCAALNSDIKDFGDDCVQDLSSTLGISLYNTMQTMEDTLYQRAAMTGLLPVEWAIVMHPTIWSEVVKYLPCQMLGDSCVSPVQATAAPPTDATTGPAIIQIDGSRQGVLRQELMNTMTIAINGRMYPVVLDHGVPLTTNAGPPVSYTSDIFFVPLRAAGETLLYWNHIDYRNQSSVLQPLPNSVSDMIGWTDSGRFHMTVDKIKRCFVVDAKMEAGLILKAPHLAGRIQNVRACPAQAKPMPDFN